MTVPIYQVDAFAEKLFQGNPAAVCPLTRWLSDNTMQLIALENNLAETAFIVPNGRGYDIRWFTPAVEVDLCGHATLASAWVVFHALGFEGAKIDFHSPRSGPLSVTRQGKLLTLDFPTDIIAKVEAPESILACFADRPLEVWKGKTDYMVVFAAEEQVRNFQPDFGKLAAIEARGIIITAPGSAHDFVSRFFAPQSGVNEDPVTGSAHTTLTPYWTARLGKSSLKAKQISSRGGNLHCTLANRRVLIGGEAVSYLRGEITLPD